jgi:hypothetical protein
MVNLYKSLFVLAVSFGAVSSTNVQKRDTSAFLNTLPTLASAVSTLGTIGTPSITGPVFDPTILNVSIKWQISVVVLTVLTL